MMFRRIVFIVILILVGALLTACLPRGRADLPKVPTRTPDAVTAVPAASEIAAAPTPTLAATGAPTEAAPPEPKAAQPEPTATELPFDLPPPQPVLSTVGEVQAYAGPGRQFEPLQRLGPGTRADLVGRTFDNSWYAIAGPGDGAGAPTWVEAAEVVVEGVVELVGILGPQAQPVVYPVVDAETGFLIGGWAGNWLDPRETVARLGTLPYRLYVDNHPAGALDGRPFEAAGGPCPVPIVSFEPGIPDNALALLAAATWAPDARPVAAMDATPALQAQVQRLLQEQGLAQPEVRIEAIQRVDLEGDQLDEILITATRLSDDGGRAVSAGDYALVALQRAGGGPLAPLLLDVYLQDDALAFPYRPAVQALLDVNGDGKLEVVVRAQRHEGLQVTLYESTGQTLLPVLTAGCHL